MLLAVTMTLGLVIGLSAIEASRRFAPRAGRQECLRHTVSPRQVAPPGARGYDRLRP